MARNHFKLPKIATQASVIAVAALFCVNAYAIPGDKPAVVINSWSDTGNHLRGNTISITATGSELSPHGFTDNTTLSNSASGHAGDWFTFENHFSDREVFVTVRGNSDFIPGVTVWATGGVEFDGGTEAFGGETSSAFFGTPHSFNATGAIGDPGTLWMANGHGGNVIETLGYAVANTSINFTSGTGWGETIQAGLHDVSVTNTFETRVRGGAGIHGPGATIWLIDLAPGWYTIYVGGTDGETSGGGYSLSVVSAVPEAKTWTMLIVGLSLIGWRLRKQRIESGTGLIPG